MSRASSALSSISSTRTIELSCGCASTAAADSPADEELAGSASGSALSACRGAARESGASTIVGGLSGVDMVRRSPRRQRLRAMRHSSGPADG